MAENTVYAVTRVRAREKGCLSAAFLESMLAAGSEAEARRLLQDKGWPGGDTETMLHAAERELIAFLREILPGETDLLAPVTLRADYHNLKAALKESLRESAVSLDVPGGEVPYEKLRAALMREDFSSLPEALAAPAQKALALLRETHDGRRSDAIVDRAYMERLWELCQKRDEVCRAYAEAELLKGCVKTAVRAVRMGCDAGFLEEALPECGPIGKDELILAARRGEEGVSELLEKRGWRPESLSSLAAFECAADSRLIRSLRQTRTAIEGTAPVFAFYLARQSEIRTVRILLTGLRVSADPALLRERIRESYV